LDYLIKEKEKNMNKKLSINNSSNEPTKMEVTSVLRNSVASQEFKSDCGVEMIYIFEWSVYYSTPKTAVNCNKLQ
jgi:hypothetical protein